MINNEHTLTNYWRLVVGWFTFNLFREQTAILMNLMNRDINWHIYCRQYHLIRYICKHKFCISVTVLVPIWTKTGMSFGEVIFILLLLMHVNPAYAGEEQTCNCKWAASSEFVSSSIPSWQILTAHAKPFRGPEIWFSVWRFLLTRCLYVRAAEVLARLRGCAGLPEPSLLA